MAKEMKGFATKAENWRLRTSHGRHVWEYSDNWDINDEQSTSEKNLLGLLVSRR